MATTRRPRTAARNNGEPEVITPEPTNNAAPLIAFQLPYTVEFTIKGVAPLFFHRFSKEAVRATTDAKKGSAEKKTDNVEAYIWRDEDGFICLPGSYVFASIASKKEGAARYFQDPRSPRKSAVDLYKAACVPITVLAPIMTVDNKRTRDWDSLDERRMVVNSAGIIRARPAFNVGWSATFQFTINLPEYVSEQDFLAVLSLAGRAVGVGDSRPSYGRFQVVRFVTL